MPPTGGELYAIESDKPAGTPELTIDLPMSSTFNATVGLNVTGSSTADTVYYAAVMPGSVLEQGQLPVSNGKIQYFFSPEAMNKKSQTYDTVNRVTGKTEIGGVAHLTFFSEEKTASGVTYYSFARVIMRGATVISTR